MPFAFWKMEPFYGRTIFNRMVPANDKQIIELTLMDKKMISQEYFGSALYGDSITNNFFVYNHNIGYGFYYSTSSLNQSISGAHFFIGELTNQYDSLICYGVKKQLNKESSEWLYNDRLYTKKSVLNILDEIRSEKEKAACRLSVDEKPPKELKKYIDKLKDSDISFEDEALGLIVGTDNKSSVSTIRLKREFSTHSQLSIINREDKTLVKRDNQEIDFQVALTKYFDYDNKNKAIVDFVNNYTNKHSLSKSEYVLGKAVDDLNRSEEQVNLLNRSTILSVFAVVKGDYGNESIVWGLAENNDTKEKFHWVTDLKADISVLLNQYSNEKKN